MWESDDVLRSVRRYLALILADPWELRVERRQVTDDERPVAVVEVGDESVLRAREAITQGNVESLYPLTISAYPAVPTEGGDVDVIREARAAATALKTLLKRWVIFGMKVEDKDGVQWSGPFRIPLYDYAEVPLTGPDRVGPDDPHDVLWVQRESLAVKAIQDEDDLRRWSVFADMRVTLEQPGRERDEDEGYEVTEGIRGSYVPPPG